jgi:hypothetical protein
MKNRVRLFFWIGVVLLISTMADAGDVSEQWRLYRNTAFGYELLYPSGWEVIEARPRISSKSTWAGFILQEGEVQKVTFRERNYYMWPGEFEIRVMRNDGKSDLNAWIATYDVKAIDDSSLITESADTALGSRSAKQLKIFMFDHQGIEIIAVNGDFVYLLGFSGENPNDPNQQKHSNICDHMVASFRFE